MIVYHWKNRFCLEDVFYCRGTLHSFAFFHCFEVGRTMLPSTKTGKPLPMPCPNNIQIMNNEPAVQFSTTQQFVASSSLHEFQHRLQFRVASADDNTSYSPFRKKDRRDCPPLRGGNDFFSCPTNVSHRTLSVPPSSFTFLRQVSR